jgi:hypothetical protein
MKEIGNRLWLRKRLKYQHILDSDIANECQKISRHIDSKNARQILWHLLNSIEDKPQCKMCKNLAKWHEDKREYREFCGGSCATKYGASLYKIKCMLKFGVSHHTQLQSCKNKKIATCLQKYKTLWSTQNKEVIQKRKESCQEIYGGNAPSCSKMVRDKMEHTCFERFGVKFSSQNPENRRKAKETFLRIYKEDNPNKNTLIKDAKKKFNNKKYNRNNHMQCRYSDESYKIISDPKLLEDFLKNKSIKGGAKELGMSWITLYQIIKKLNLKIVNGGVGISSPQREFALWLTENNIFFDYSTRKIIKPYELDFYIPNLNLAIEFNGDYWHMNPKIYNENTINKVSKKTAKQIWDRDKLKENLCKEKDINLITVWESDWNNNSSQIKDQILNFVKSMK